jgi:prepilin-type N-terminal cleavage/methylation domain-containing protein
MEDVMKRSLKGFTLIELLVVVAIIALLIAILIPSLGRAKELANRAACGANLSGVGKAFNLYGAEQSDTYPTIPGSGFTNAGSPNAAPAAPANTTTDSAINNYYTAQVESVAAYAQNSDELANLWLLVLKGTVSTKSFICKSDPASPAAAALTSGSNYFNNFNNGTAAAGTAVSYGFAWAFNAAGPAAYWRNTIDASLPIGSDIGQQTGAAGGMIPGTNNGGKLSNSQNHTGGEGQNVVWGDAHVSFEKQNGVGQQGDNIFGTINSTNVTSGNQTGISSARVIVPPLAVTAGNFDTIMVPARNGTGW